MRRVHFIPNPVEGERGKESGRVFDQRRKQKSEASSFFPQGDIINERLETVVPRVQKKTMSPKTRALAALLQIERWEKVSFEGESPKRKKNRKLEQLQYSHKIRTLSSSGSCSVPVAGRAEKVSFEAGY